MRKKLLLFAMVAIAALASCAKTEIRPEVESRDVHFVVNTAENEEVKSFIENNLDGTYTPKWSKGDELAMFVGTIGETTTKPTGVLKNLNEAGELAKFDGTVTGIEGDGTFKSFAPASAFAIGYKDETAGINLAASQKPSSLTIDETCDILVAKEAGYMADAAGEVTIEGLNFKRMFSIVKVALKGPATLNGERVQEFSLTAPEGTVLAGRAAIDLSTATIKQWNIENNAVTAIYEADEPVFGGAAGLENVVWLVVNPCTITSGEKVVLAGETAGYTFSKEVTLPKDLVFPQSQLAVINLTLAEENCTKKQAENRIYVENFGKVTENKTQPQPSATGAVGTGVSENLTYVYSGNNTNIRVNNNGHSSNDPFLYISTESDSFTIEKIVLNNESSLKLSAQARTASGTQILSVSYKESSATVWTKASSTMSAGTNTFDTVQSVIFSIDSSVKSLDLKFESTGATLVDDIVLESFEDTRVKLDVPANLLANVDEAVSNKINLTWNAVSYAKSYEVVLSTEGKTDIVKTAESASLSVESLDYSTSYSIKVRAISSDSAKFIDSDYCATVSVTTGVKPEGGSDAPKTYTLQFGKNYNSESIQDYTSTWSVKCDEFTWDVVNWNNNQNGWTYVKAGSKNAASVATITTKTAMPEAISTVTMTIDKITTTSVNSIKMEVISATGSTVETISGTAKQGDCVFNITNPQKDCKYKITVDCKQGSSNGLVQVSKVVYTNK